MPEYLELEVTTDDYLLAQEAIAYLESQVPGWQANPANIETWIIEAVARMAAESAIVAAEVPTAIFRYLAEDIAGLTPIDWVAAIAQTTWFLTDTDGHTIEAGSYVSIGDLSWQVVDDVVVPPGVSNTGEGEVQLVALEEGSAGNDLSDTPRLESSLAWVNNIVLVGTTTGGVDGETDDEFLSRMVAEFRLMSPRPILPGDFEVLARRIPGVARAVALDLYNPDDDTYDNERMLTISAIDENGEYVGDPTMEQVQTYLDSLREVNFVVNILEPEVSEIDVVVTVAKYDEFEATSVDTEVTAIIEGYLHPANWGKPSFDPVRWMNTTTLYYFELIGAINRHPGVKRVVSLTINDGSGAVSADIDLDGAIPLTTPGTVAVTVV